MILIAGIVAIILVVVLFLLGVADNSNSSRSLTDKYVRKGKVNLIIVDNDKNKVTSHSSGKSIFLALDKLLLDEENKLSECNTSTGKKRHLDNMEQAMLDFGYSIPSNERNFYDKMLQDAKDEYNTCVREELEQKFDKSTQRLQNQLEEKNADIIDWSFSTCDEGHEKLDEFLRIRNSLLDKASEMDIYDTVIENLAFICDIDKDTMRSESLLISYFDPYLTAMQPEANRKAEMMSTIMQNIPDTGGIQRSTLFSNLSTKMNKKELSICYKKLLEKKQIREERKGNPYYTYKASQSHNQNRHATHPAKYTNSPIVLDKQESKMAKITPQHTTINNSNAPVDTQKLMDYPSIEAFIPQLDEKNISYCDKRSKGGYFWVDGSSPFDEYISNITIAGQFFQRGRHSSHFNGSPGYYIK